MTARSPIRVLFVLTSPVRGGVEELVLSLLRRLDRREFEPGLSAPAPLLEGIAEEIADSGVPTFAVAASGWTQWREIRALTRAIKAFRPDIVNPHLSRSTLVAAPLAKWLGVPCVVETYHGREAWRRGVLRGSFVVDRIVALSVDRVIAVSEAARDFLVRVKRIPPGTVDVVPNGRDMSLFDPGCGGLAIRRELGLGQQSPVLGIVGRLEEQKGHRYGLEAFAHIVRRFPQARLLIVGEGSLRRVLERQARELGITDNVVFTGFRTDVPRLFDAMDVVVLPSLYEGMPLVAIEAAAMAKPIVATDVDGTAEVVDEGETGCLVPPGDSLRLARALRELLERPGLIRLMGENARRRAISRFGDATTVSKTMDVYRLTLEAVQASRF